MKRLGNLFLAPLLLQICILCALCVLVSLPPVWHPIYRVTMAEKLSRFEKGHLYARDSAMISDGLWSEESYGAIAGKLKGYMLGEKEQRHFEDVRKLLRKTLGLAICLSLALWIARKRFHWPTVWKQALILFIGEAVVSGVWVSISWRHMFKTLHWWIFQNDSWILPNKCYSLFLYPHAVWQALGLIVFMGMLAVILGGYGVANLEKSGSKRI